MGFSMCFRNTSPKLLDFPTIYLPQSKLLQQCTFEGLDSSDLNSVLHKNGVFSSVATGGRVYVSNRYLSQPGPGT